MPDRINWEITTQFRADFHNSSYVKLNTGTYSKLCSNNGGIVLTAIINRPKWNG